MTPAIGDLRVEGTPFSAVHSSVAGSYCITFERWMRPLVSPAMTTILPLTTTVDEVWCDQGMGSDARFCQPSVRGSYTCTSLWFIVMSLPRCSPPTAYIFPPSSTAARWSFGLGIGWALV